MSRLVTAIARRRLVREGKYSLILMVTVLFSMGMISFFLFFSLGTLASTGSNELPMMDDFLKEVRQCMGVTVAFLILLVSMTLRTHCRMRAGEIKQALAVLTSVGAQGGQKRHMIRAEVLYLYLLPVAVGALVGIAPGLIAGRQFVKAQEPISGWPLYVALALCMAVVALVWIYFVYLHSTRQSRNSSLIGAVCRQVFDIPGEVHGYRNSKTFRAKGLLRRLAERSMDHSRERYRGIALTFASAALYPVLALLLFWEIGTKDVIVDMDPYDGVSTTAAVLAAVDQIAWFLAGCFFVLAFLGAMQAFFMMQIQMRARRSAMRVYVAVGMSPTDTRRMIGFELRSVLMRGIVYLVIGAMVATVIYWFV